MPRLPLTLGIVCGLLVALALTNRAALTSAPVLLAILGVVLGVVTFTLRRR